MPGWAPVYADVAVVHPRSATAERSLRDEERTKVEKYSVWRDQARVINADFYPFVFESFGLAGSGVRRLVQRLADRAAADLGLSAAAERRRWLELLAVSLQLSQSEALLDG